MPQTIKHFWVWLLALVPVLIALVFTGPADFASTGALLNVAGRLTGIGGLSMLLVATALCCRVPGFDLPFGGLTKLWQLHHQLGAVAFMLLLAHPLLLAFAAVEVSLMVAIATLFSPTMGLWLGWLALILMMIFLAPSFAFFGEPDYQRWKWLHRLSGPAVFLALMHTALLTRTFSGLWAWLIWGGLFSLALFALGYRGFISRIKGRKRYRVEHVDAVANNVVELTLKPLAKNINYIAGQFVYLTPFDKTLVNGFGEEHPYTISSAPGEENIRIAIKDLGDASRAIASITLGTEVAIEGPYGDFFPRRETQAPELWIAGGIGITPFLSRLRHLAHTGERASVQLVYCVQDEARAIFLEEIKALVAAIDGVSLSIHFFYREGPLSKIFLDEHVPDYRTRHGYICGPLPLIDSAKKTLATAGVPRDKVTTEEFVLL